MTSKKIRLVVDVDYDDQFIDVNELVSTGSTLFYTKYTEGKVVSVME